MHEDDVTDVTANITEVHKKLLLIFIKKLCEYKISFMKQNF